MTSASRSGWSWDEDAGVYRRLQNGEPMVVTGEGQVGAANVIVVLTDIGRGGCCDTAGNPFTVTRLEGSGDAILWRDGQRFDVTWSKERRRPAPAVRRRRRRPGRARAGCVLDPPRPGVGGPGGPRRRLTRPHGVR